jgi:hypothetical protein
MNDLLLVLSSIASVVAVSMTVVAWHTLRNERRRSAARVDALRADIYTSDLPLEDESRSVDTVNALFEPATRDRGSRMAFAVAVGGAAVVTLVISVALREPSSDAVRTASSGGRAHAGHVVPLELMSLDHDMAGKALTIRGTVRNPTVGGEISHLTAVVLLFDHQGGYLASGRADVQETALEPGAAAPFVITVNGLNDVGRYRISFRSDDRVVPHVDRRDGQRTEMRS